MLAVPTANWSFPDSGFDGTLTFGGPVCPAVHAPSARTARTAGVLIEGFGTSELPLVVDGEGERLLRRQDVRPVAVRVGRNVGVAAVLEDPARVARVGLRQLAGLHAGDAARD